MYGVGMVGIVLLISVAKFIKKLSFVVVSFC